MRDDAETGADQTDKAWDRVDDARMERSRLHGARRTNGRQRSAGKNDARERGWMHLGKKQHRRIPHERTPSTSTSTRKGADPPVPWPLQVEELYSLDEDLLQELG